MKYFGIILIFLSLFGPSFSQAKVPENTDTWEKWEINKKINNIYEQTVDILMSSGYDRSVNGLKVGFIRSDFDLSNKPSIHVMPMLNRTDEISKSLEFFTTKITEKTVQLLKETGIFSSVTTGEKEETADLKVQIYLRAMGGRNCLWGLEVYDGKTGEKILSGFDKVSTAGRDFAFGIFLNSLENPYPVDYFLENIPKRATLFIGRNNLEFNREYFDKLRRRSPRGY